MCPARSASMSAASSRRQTHRTSGAAADQVRVRAQREDREGTRHQIFRRLALPRRRGDRVKRREFISLFGGAAAWPLAAGAQQPAMPVTGLLNAGSPGPLRQQVAAFHEGLKESGYVEGQNVAVEYRWAESQYDRLPALAADLVRRPVSRIVAGRGAPVLVAGQGASS